MSTKQKKVLAPTDTDVKIPAAVTAAAANADAVHAAAYAPVVPAEPAPEPVVVEPPSPEIPADSLAPAPVVTSEVMPAAPAATPDWEHRFNSMKGRYDRAEVDKRQLAERVAGLEQVIATMHVTAPLAPAASPSAAERFVTPEERASYGDDFIDVAGRAAEERFSPIVQELKNTVKNLSERLESVGTHLGQSDRNKMHAHLDTHCPNWLQINEADAFKNWLALPDAYSGAIRHELLKAAYARNDSTRVLAFFQGFLDQEAALAPRPEPTPAEAVLTAPKVPLESFAAPGRAKTAAATPVPAEKPTFTHAQITQFYVDVANSKFVGREAEKARIDKQIFDAAREGRVR